MAAEHEKFLLNQKVAKMEAQVKLLKNGSNPGESIPTTPAPEAQAFDHIKIKQEIDDYQFSFPTPRTYSSPSSMTYSPSVSPSQASLSFDDESLATSADMTQHPAAMLCDLQCQSAEACQEPSPQHTAKTTKTSQATFATPSSSANQTLNSTTLALKAYSQTKTLSNSTHRTTTRRTHQSLNSQSTNTTSPPKTSPSMRWWTSAPTKATTMAMALSLETSTSLSLLKVWLQVLQRLSLRSPPLARPFEDATGWVMRRETSSTTSRLSEALRWRSSELGRRLSGRSGLRSSVRCIELRSRMVSVYEKTARLPGKLAEIACLKVNGVSGAWVLPELGWGALARKQNCISSSDVCIAGINLTSENAQLIIVSLSCSCFPYPVHVILV